MEVTALLTSSINRQHTIHSVQRDGGSLVGVLEKDWYDAKWCDLFWVHFRVQRGNHLFHVTSEIKWFSVAHAENMVTAVLRGSFTVHDLRGLSITDLIAKKRK